MNMYDIIEKKRDEEVLSENEIRYFVKNYTEGRIKDYQASALLMAIYLNGMSDKETLALTRAMIDSGDKFHLQDIKSKVIDKHSTGGVGDTVTLVLGPMVSALGVPFAKMSGKGLGHTGGTIDKLEAFKGINLNLTDQQFYDNINDINIAISGQTSNIAPADKKIYSLRDVTATVDNISLIASSIMSKKLAIESDGIVLDVKLGSAAFMKNLESARDLANEMVSLSKAYGRNSVALITNMDEPLGYAVGNNLEVIEAIDSLKGEGPKDLVDLSVELGSEILILSGLTNDRDKAKDMLYKTIENGSALKQLKLMVEKQNGDSSFIDDTSKFGSAKYVEEFNVDKNYYISEIDGELIGKAALSLGAGREDLDSKVDLQAGLILRKKVDDYIEKGESLITIYSNSLDKIKDAKKILKDAYKLSKYKTNNKKPLILDRIY